MNKCRITLLLLLSILIIGVTACTANNEELPLSRGEMSDNNVSPYYANDYDNRMTDRDSNNNMNNTMNNNEEAKKMADTAGKVNGVDDATVVIAGGNVYVALDLDDKIQSNQASNVERDVYNKLNKLARNNYRVMITSDADLFGRLRDIGDGINAGTPTDIYDNDFRMFDKNFRGNIR